MPFRPKLAELDEQPMDDESQLDLPSDLALLGQQLQDDSAHLAELYPADMLDKNWLTRGDEPKRRRSRGGKRKRTTAAIALASVLLMVAVPAALKSLFEPTETSVAVQEDESPQPQPSVAPIETAAPVPNDPAVAAVTVPSHDDYLPATYVVAGPFSPELTGPQQEAQFDIWIKEHPEVVRLEL